MSERASNDDSSAVVRHIDGEIVIDDPAAIGFVRGVGKHNCGNTLEMNRDRVEHFKQRAQERNLSADEVVVTVINVDDVHGAVLAEALMPGFDWQEIRDRGEVPFARGLAAREGVQSFLDIIDREAAASLRTAENLSVVVVDHGVAETYKA